MPGLEGQSLPSCLPSAKPGWAFISVKLRRAARTARPDRWWSSSSGSTTPRSSSSSARSSRRSGQRPTGAKSCRNRARYRSLPSSGGPTRNRKSFTDSHTQTARINIVSAPFRSYVLVSRDQIARNFRNVRSLVGPDVEVCGVVKADAYGHGAAEVSRVLVAEGARWLAVSSVDEGANLRCSGIHGTRILVMGGFLPYEGEALIEYGLTPAVHSLDQIRQVDYLARSSGKPLRYHLKIDSGMGRLGTRAAAAEIVATVR